MTSLFMYSNDSWNTDSSCDNVYIKIASCHVCNYVRAWYVNMQNTVYKLTVSLWAGFEYDLDNGTNWTMLIWIKYVYTSMPTSFASFLQ